MTNNPNPHRTRPNILFILTDQHNPHIAGYAGDPYARTGALDRLAAQSTWFSAAYCQSPLCTPSRISFLTGKYAYDCSAWHNGSMLTSEHRTFAQHLSAHGYTTCLVGKMHLYGERRMGGFDHRPYGDVTCTKFPFHQPDPPETCDGRWTNHKVGRFPWAGVTQIPESQLVDGLATREALAFLREHHDAQPDKPWLMTVGYSRPHYPLTAPGRYVRRALADPPPLPALPPGYPEALHPHDRNIVSDFHLTDFSPEQQRRGLACYYACVDYVDDCIGELLDGLRAEGLLENTYIIYGSDHGDMTGEHGLWWKRTYYDASAGVPLMICGPGLRAGARCDLPVELVDLYPTFCEMAGVPVPAGLPGESLLPLCRGDEQARVKRHARCDFFQGNDRSIWMFRMIRDERRKLVEFAWPDSPPVLFDLDADPGETRNLLAGQERVSPDDEVDRLRQLLRGGIDWPAILERKDAAKAPPAKPGVARTITSPAQYMMPDGRIIDADRALFPGL